MPTNVATAAIQQPKTQSPTYSAISYSGSLLEKITTWGKEWRVLSLHEHACNLLSNDNELLALVSPRHGNGPFHIVVPFEALARLRCNETDHRSNHSFVFLHEVISLTQAIPWHPTLLSLTHSSNIAITIRSLHESYPLPLALANLFDHSLAQLERARFGLAKLIDGVQADNLALSAEGAHVLAGLGPGLTPAGDDILVGFMAGLVLWGDQLRSGLPWQDICQRIGQVAASRTTRLSAAWLRHAAQGEFGEPWHDLRQALQGGQQADIDQAVRRILDTGATSGQAAMVGFELVVALQ